MTNPYEFAPILVGRVEAARLLSISVPEIDRLRRRELPKMGLEETHDYAKTLIPD